MGAEDIDVEHRLRATLRAKAGQLDADADRALPPASAARRRGRGLAVALVGMAAVLLGVVVLARSAGSPDRVGTADSVPSTAEAPLPAWVPPGMDVWGVSSETVLQTSVVVLREEATGRTIDLMVQDRERAPQLALTGAFADGNGLGPFRPDSSSIAWGERDRSFRAVGHGLDAAAITLVAHGTTLRAEGQGYTASTVPDGWVESETRREPAAVTTTARFATGVPDADSPDLTVVRTVATDDGDGAGWTNTAAYLDPEPDGAIWTTPGDTDGSSSVMVVDRHGQAVSAVTRGAQRLRGEALRELVEGILRSPRGDLPVLAGRAAANLATTPVVAAAPIGGDRSLEVRGTPTGGVAAVCEVRPGDVRCPPPVMATGDLVAVVGTDGTETVVLGASRRRPAFADAEVRAAPLVVEDGGWYLFRAVPRSVGLVITVDGGPSVQVLLP